MRAFMLIPFVIMFVSNVYGQTVQIGNNKITCEGDTCQIEVTSTMKSATAYLVDRSLSARKLNEGAITFTVNQTQFKIERNGKTYTVKVNNEETIFETITLVKRFVRDQIREHL